MVDNRVFTQIDSELLRVPKKRMYARSV